VVKILTVSDEVDPLVYSPAIQERYGDVDLVISCGDLPYPYLDYIVSSLNRPLYYVHGNHDLSLETSSLESETYPLGGKNLHGQISREKDLLLAGMEGSIQYNLKSPYQYPQYKFWNFALNLVPGLMVNKLKSGRFLDIFVTHAPPAGIHDRSDWAHQGIKAFRWLINVFQPAYHLHGHVHLYRPGEVRESICGKTRVINAFRSRLIEIPDPGTSGKSIPVI
jgi:Icc-related predicted phosphoesterase